MRQLERPTANRFVHAAAGLASEAGEVSALVKRSMVSGDPVSCYDVLDECGDILYYVAMALSSVGFDMNLAMKCNVAKLQRRVTHGKDKGAEREVMKGIAAGK